MLHQSSRWIFGLGPQLVLFLLIAILPIGLIAVYQTRQAGIEAVNKAELAVIALTEKAAFDERLLIERAFSSGDALSDAVIEFRDDDARCSKVFTDFLARNPQFSFAGFLPVDGMMLCSSALRAYDFSEFPGFDKAMNKKERNVAVNTDAPLSGKSVVIASEPIFDQGTFLGFVSISIPHERQALVDDALPANGLVALLTLNADGAILTSTGDLARAADDLPAGVAGSDWPVQGSGTFRTKSRIGEDHIYAVTPVFGDVMDVLGIWDATHPLTRRSGLTMPLSVFPILIWAASLIVAYIAVHSLVIRHVTALGREMRSFARDRSRPERRSLGGMPVEIRDMSEDFDRMARAIQEDEAALESSVTEKKLLLKEVHHRVKNNLQLISSILNMQIRKADSADTRDALKGVQDRVLSLATIHRDLYQSEGQGLLDAGQLIREVVAHTDQLIAHRDPAIEQDISIETALLVPDQAVPLSLLTAEALTNAAKNIGPDHTGRTWLKVHFKVEGDQKARLAIENSVNANQPGQDGTGLGAQLIKAFSIQLGGTPEIDAQEDSYALQVAFPIEAVSEEALDY